MFSFVNIVITLLLTKTAYETSKKIVINQLKDQVDIHTRFIAQSIPSQYLNYIDPFLPGNKADTYLREKMISCRENLNLSEIFIFNGLLEVIFQTEVKGQTDIPVLSIYNEQIKKLEKQSLFSTRPFQSENKKWYMWGIYRIDENYWICVRENAQRIKSVEKLNIIFPFFLFIGVALTLSAAYITAISLSKPIKKLSRFSSQIGRGNFKTQLPDTFKGELGILAKAMNKMKEDIHQNTREKEAMLAQIAHEIRNPLGGIELFTGLIKEDMEKNGIDSKDLKHVNKEIGRLKEIINHYLSYSRPLFSTPEKINLSTIVSECFSLFQDQIKNKAIKTHYQFKEDIPFFFDPKLLKQVFINLISNSLDVLETNGKITLSCDKFKNKTIITYEDNGPGFPESYKKRPLKPFFTTKESGTGLGLVICNKICMENNCELKLDLNRTKGVRILLIQNEDGRRRV